jgi:hypothetical protein
MNNHGEVVGFWEHCDTPATEAFFWSESTGLITLPRPDGVGGARADDVNDNRLVVGRHSITGVGTRGFVYDINNPDAGYTYLEPLHGVGGSSLSANNNSGIAVGSRSIGKPGQSPNPFNAVIWNTKTGEVIDLGVMSGPNSWASGVSNNGNVVGSMGSSVPNQGWALVDGTMSFLGPVPNGISSGAFDVNTAGAVASAGLLKPNGGTTGQPTVWQDHQWELLPHPPKATTAGAHFITDLGQVGGTAAYPGNPGWVEWAVLWQHGAVHDLNELLESDSNVSLRNVRGMNDTGDILVRGVYNGRTVGVLLTPIGQPIGDLNADCAVDVLDLLMLLSTWGPCGHGLCVADLNGDGMVDVLDLLIVLDNWTIGGGKEVPRK